jgi:predicted permease
MIERVERLLSECRHRLRAVLRRGELERELDDELALHLELEREKLMRAGLSPADATRAASLAFGGVDRIGEASRDARGVRWIDVASQDLRHAVRQLAANPGFTAIVVVTLALGVGANAALFTMLDHLLLRPPAVVQTPDELFRLYRHALPNERTDGWVTPGFPYPAVENIATALPPDARLATYGIGARSLGTGEDAPRVMTVAFGPRYFDLLGVAPVLGRRATAEESRIDGGSPVALISHAEWQSRFGADPDVIGRRVELAWEDYTIIGVLPPGFTGLDVQAASYWIPLGGVASTFRDPLPSSWNYGGTHIIVRAPESQRERIAAIASGVIGRGAPDWFGEMAVTAGPLKAAFGPQDQAPELAVATRLALVSAILLLIACANVANLGLARALRRRQEIAVRLALGISRARLVGMLLLETLLLATVAAAGAMLVAYWGGTALRRLLFPDFAWPGSPLDGRIALFALAVGLAAGLLAGLPPALRAGRFGVATALKGTAHDGGAWGGTADGARSRLRAGLVSAQAALCVVLLVAAGAFIRSLQAVASIDTGFDTNRLVLVGMSFSDREDHDAERRELMPQLADRLSGLPQVESVALANGQPIIVEHSFGALFAEDGSELPFERMPPAFHIVEPGFFDVMGIRLLGGRTFTDAERDPASPVIVVNDEMASRIWPGVNPLGRCLRMLRADAPCARVIGVVETANRDRLIETDRPMHFYRSLAQSTNPTPRMAVVRARPGQVESVVTAARALVRQHLPAGAYPDVRPLASVFDRELRPWRLGATLFSVIGLLALAVAVIGTYSVVGYVASQRRHEIGVRMALGARAAHIARIVVSDAVAMVAVGLVAGIAAAFAFGSLIEALLYETSAREPGVIVTVAILLLLAAGLAALVPAWRATRVDPTEALRSE